MLAIPASTMWAEPSDAAPLLPSPWPDSLVLLGDDASAVEVEFLELDTPVPVAMMEDDEL